MKKSENPLFFLLALWLVCIALAGLIWWALAAFIAHYRQ